MLFNSLEFGLFFPIVCALYFLLPFWMRTPLLLVASCAFYMAFVPAYILILLVTILIDYFAGIYLETVQGKGRKLILVTSIVATCLVLFVFKYFNFFTGTLVGVARLAGWNIPAYPLSILLPIGLSFHTFQSLSYVIEVYRGHQKSERDFVTYATYVMFFPQLVAGPIERPQNLLHQFHERHSFVYADVTTGLKRIAWGFFKKLVVADRVALYVNDVYADPHSFNGLQLSIATVFFAYQIYCDFSGYSDIAIGTARVLGFRLMENFDTPYRAASVSEFWRRWHISLSTWFRDYVYVPLGGSRVSPPRWMINILITFGMSGLWHGANWTYVVWGLLNGFYLIVGAKTKDVRSRLLGLIGVAEEGRVRGVIRVGTTFLLICFSWTIFRAKSLSDAGYILTNFWRKWDIHAISTEQFLLRQLPIALSAIAVLELGQWVQRNNLPIPKMAQWPTSVRWLGYSAALVGIVLLGIYRRTQFIYFQF